MPRFMLLAAVALGTLTACESGADASKSADSAPATDAQHAAAITIALRVAPTKADSVLAAHGVTADQLEQMMFRIAADSAMSADYRRLTER